MRIGPAAAEAGVSIDTIRFYERRGVLPAAPRTGSGYRVYTGEAVRRVRLVRRLQQLGLTLDEITAALHDHSRGAGSCGQQRWRLEASLGRVEARIAELAGLAAGLQEALAGCEAGTCTVLGPPR